MFDGLASLKFSPYVFIMASHKSALAVMTFSKSLWGCQTAHSILIVINNHQIGLNFYFGKISLFGFSHFQLNTHTL